MYIVESENKLGYTLSEPSENKPVGMVVMAVDVLKGGDPTLIDRDIMAHNYRQATKEDEDRFRVRL